MCTARPAALEKAGKLTEAELLLTAHPRLSPPATPASSEDVQCAQSCPKRAQTEFQICATGEFPHKIQKMFSSWLLFGQRVPKLADMLVNVGLDWSLCACGAGQTWPKLVWVGQSLAALGQSWHEGEPPTGKAKRGGCAGKATGAPRTAHELQGGRGQNWWHRPRAPRCWEDE